MRAVRYTVQGTMELRFDRESNGAVTIRLYQHEHPSPLEIPFLLKEFSVDEWAVIVAVLGREYNDASYCEAVDRQLPFEQSAHEKAARMQRRLYSA